jgi:hypothetical protein
MCHIISLRDYSRKLSILRLHWHDLIETRIRNQRRLSNIFDRQEQWSYTTRQDSRGLQHLDIDWHSDSLEFQEFKPWDMHCNRKVIYSMFMPSDWILFYLFMQKRSKLNWISQAVHDANVNVARSIYYVDENWVWLSFDIIEREFLAP